MFARIKSFLYFPVASYFRFLASIRLARWNPRIVVVTGSSGKTTLLYLIQSQLGESAKYSHQANSSFGIPFDILDIHRTSLMLSEWPGIFISSIINVFKPVPKEKIYVVEADCDRPKEGRFLSSLLNPEVTLWTNVSKTHGMNFDRLITAGKFENVEKAIAHEFGFFAERTKKLVIFNRNNKLECSQLYRVGSVTVGVSLRKSLTKYSVNLCKTEFILDKKRYRLNCLMPKETGVLILMCFNLMQYLGLKFDSDFKEFKLPPGRSGCFSGIKGTTLIDSSYNANLDSMRVVLEMFNAIIRKPKWLVLGDMLEQGMNEKYEHEQLANMLVKIDVDRIVLVGPRLGKHTYTHLKKPGQNMIIEHFLEPKDALRYLKEEIHGKEIILFKGARFLEGVIEGLLRKKEDSKYLPRRERVWQIRRRKWGL